MNAIFDPDFGMETRAALLKAARKYHHSRAVVRIVLGSPFRMILLQPNERPGKDDIIFRSRSRGSRIQILMTHDVWSRFSGWNILYVDQCDFTGFQFRNRKDIESRIKQAEEMGRIRAIS